MTSDTMQVGARGAPSQSLAQGSPRLAPLLRRLRRSLSSGGTWNLGGGCYSLPRTQSASAACALADGYVNVTVVINKRVPFGDRLAVIGDAEELGSWRSSSAMSLHWSDGDVWSAAVSLTPGLHEFKCAVIRADGGVEWEQGSNRVLAVPFDYKSSLLAICEWCDTTATEVTPDLTDPRGSSEALHDQLLQPVTGVFQLGASAGPASSANWWLDEDGSSLGGSASEAQGPQSADADALSEGPGPKAAEGAESEVQVDVDGGSSDDPAALVALSGPSVEALFPPLEGVALDLECPPGLLASHSYEVLDSEELGCLEVVNDSSSEDLSSADTLPLLPAEAAVPPGSKGALGASSMVRSFSLGVSELSLDTVLTEEAGSGALASSPSGAALGPAEETDLDDFQSPALSEGSQLSGMLPGVVEGEEEGPGPISIRGEEGPMVAGPGTAVEVAQEDSSTSSSSQGREVVLQGGAFETDSEPDMEARSQPAAAAAVSPALAPVVAPVPVGPPLSALAPTRAAAGKGQGIKGKQVVGYKSASYMGVSTSGSLSIADEVLAAAMKLLESKAPGQPEMQGSKSAEGLEDQQQQAEAPPVPAASSPRDSVTAEVFQAAPVAAEVAKEVQAEEQEAAQGPSSAAPMVSAFGAMADEPLSSQSSSSSLSTPERMSRMDTLPLKGLSKVDLSGLMAELEEEEEELGSPTASQQLQQDQEGVARPAAAAAAPEAHGREGQGLKLDAGEDPASLLMKQVQGEEQGGGEAAAAGPEVVEDEVAAPVTPDQPRSEVDSVNGADSLSASSDSNDAALLAQQEQAAAAAAAREEELEVMGELLPVQSPRGLKLPPGAVRRAPAAAAVVAPGEVGGAHQPGVGRSREPWTAAAGLVLAASAAMIPHVNKVETGGEDAYFISSMGHGAIGVADGVSAWAEDGIDPGDYSRTLAQYCAEAVDDKTGQKGFDPRAVLRYGQMCTYKPGSATMVLAALQPGGMLHIANLGDCGVRVVRGGKVVLATEPQQHDFNLPYQMSHPRLFPETDIADSADRYTLAVQPGDIIVAGSDGLFDNLWEEELLQLLAEATTGRPAALHPADAAKMKRSQSLSKLAAVGKSSWKAMKRVSSGQSLSAVQEAAAVAAAVAGEVIGPHSSQSKGACPISAFNAREVAERGAQLLAKRAAVHAADKEFRSPWAVAAGKTYGLMAKIFAKGGKMDDITVVVAVVQDVAAGGC